MVIGGQAVFADAMPLADRLEITHVHASPEGDAFFPPIDLKHWREEKREVREAGPRGRCRLRDGHLYKALVRRKLLIHQALRRVVTAAVVPYNRSQQDICRP